MDIVALSDDEAAVNGSLNFLSEVRSPFIIRVFMERFYRGKWLVEIFDRKYPDFCVAMKNPLEPFYYMFANSPKCPFPAGVRLSCESEKFLNFFQTDEGQLRHGAFEASRSLPPQFYWRVESYSF